MYRARGGERVSAYGGMGFGRTGQFDGHRRLLGGVLRALEE